MNDRNREKEHEDVYGKSFSLYDKSEMASFTDYFRQRFVANGLDARAIFSGKRCIDAGCGGGRGTLFMLMNGAAHVTAVDISSSNIESTRRNCREFGFDAVECVESTLEQLPFPDEHFDVLWCNGVLMHTANPDACLSEITRVLKVGGQAWIYVYGAGGLYWYLVREFREILSSMSSAQVLAALQLLRLPVRYIGEYMDDWKVPYLRAYTQATFTNRLREAGYADPEPLKRGVPYDTSERRTAFPADIPWLGEGDLRYLATKGKCMASKSSALGEASLTLMNSYAEHIIERFGPLTKNLRERVAGNSVLAIAACGSLQRELRDILTKPGGLDVPAFESHFRSVIAQLKQLQSTDDSAAR